MSGLGVLLLGPFGGVLIGRLWGCVARTSELGLLFLSVKDSVFIVHIVMYGIEAVGRDPWRT